MQLLRATSRWIDCLIVGTGRVTAWLIVPLMVVILVDVIARKVPAIWYAVSDTFLADYVSSVKLQETEWHLHTVLFVVGLGYAYVHNMHVRVDLLRRSFSQKWRAYLEIFACAVLLIPYTALLIYYGWDFVQSSFLQGEGSQALTGLPHRWLIKSTLLLGIALFLLSGVRTLILACLFLRQRETGEFDDFVFDGRLGTAESVESPGQSGYRPGGRS